MLSEEQVMLRDSAMQWASEQSPVKHFRSMRNNGQTFDAEHWQAMSALGWPAIAVPEQFDGVDFGMRSLGLVIDQLAKTLTVSPLLTTSVAAWALARGGSDALKTHWLPRIAAGGARATFAFEETARHNPEQIESTFANQRLNGCKAFVHDANHADLFIVSARQEGESRLFAVPATTPGVKVESLSMVDARDTAHVWFDDVVVEPDWILASGSRLIGKTIDVATILSCAEMMGLARSAFEQTIEYLKVRVQFDQPIGAFQALQHRAAHMYTELELTQSCVDAALDAIDSEADTLVEHASVAKMMASQCLNLVSNEMIQMHGGIGMTDEHDAGFYLKRARVLEAWLGNAAYHRDRFSCLKGF